MSGPATFTGMIQGGSHVTVPGTIVPLLLRTLLVPVLVFGGVMVIATSDEWWGPPAGIALIVLALVGLVLAVRGLVTSGRAFRFAPDGVSISGRPFVPWREILGAVWVTNESDGQTTSSAVVSLMLTPHGLDLFLRRRPAAPGSPSHRDPSASPPTVNVPKMRGCTAAQTAEVLNGAITINRQRWGLPPLG